MGDTQPALGALPWFREMNEWQKAGSGLAASNVAFWVVVAVWQGGCFRPKSTLRHLRERRDFL
jgi:hypothetical protein